jgi:hypothetical protein
MNVLSKARKVTKMDWHSLNSPTDHAGKVYLRCSPPFLKRSYNFFRQTFTGVIRASHQVAFAMVATAF